MCLSFDKGVSNTTKTKKKVVEKFAIVLHIYPYLAFMRVFLSLELSFFFFSKRAHY